MRPRAAHFPCAPGWPDRQVTPSCGARISRAHQPDKADSGGNGREPEQAHAIRVEPVDRLQRRPEVGRRQRQHETLEDRHQPEAEEEISDQSVPAEVLCADPAPPSPAGGAADAGGVGGSGECR